MGGYSAMNLGAHYQVHRHVQLFVQINNRLNHRYYTATQLGTTDSPLPAVSGQFPLINSTFYAPGAPIGAWAGM